VKVSQDLLAVEKLKAQMQLFTMPGACEATKAKFMELMQTKALRELEESVSPPAPAGEPAASSTTPPPTASPSTGPSTQGVHTLELSMTPFDGQN